MKANNYQLSALRTLEIESTSLRNLERTILSESFTQACELLYNCQGKVILMGVGKSGHVARKIASSLASTGTSSFYVHPCEAGHGDAGMISSEDVVIYVSNSGEADEFVNLLHYFQVKQVPIIAITNNLQSTLANNSQVALGINCEQEACPLRLAPTSSTTNTLVLGDCLTVALLERRNLTQEDFAVSHPFGALGRRLLFKNSKVMVKEQDLPLVTPETLLADVLGVMSDKNLGCVLVVKEMHADLQNLECVGIFTDGDLRRLLAQRVDIYAQKISYVMTKRFTVCYAQELAFHTLKILEAKHISVIPVLDEQEHLVGIIHLHSLVNLGLK